MASGAAGVAGSLLEYAGWAVAMHLWFLAVYLIVVSLTPIAIAAQRRWGLLVPAALASGVVAVDVASLAGHVPYLSWLNYLLCWAPALSARNRLAKRLFSRDQRPVLLAAGSACALWLLIWLGPYPVSMIGVPGQAVQNTEPPSVAMLAFGCAQAGLAISVAPAVNQRAAGRCGSASAVASQCQRDGPVPVAHDSGGDRGGHRLPGWAVAATGRGRRISGGSPGWNGWSILSLVTAVELALLRWGRRFFAAPLPALDVPRGRWAEPVMLAGASMASYGLAFFAAEGFAPYGHFPWLTAVIFAVGVLLVALCSQGHVRVEAIPLLQ